MNKGTILVTADLVPTESNYELFIKGDLNTLMGDDMVSLFTEADARLLDLEVPLCRSNKKIKKNGPHLSAIPETINGIKKMKPTVLTLANNHIMDYGKEGLDETRHILNENDISYVGVGNTLEEASEPKIFELENGIKIGLYACAEHEFSIATCNSAGANPYDALESMDHISALKKKCDYVIVMYHGGKEHYRYPSPELRRRCRKMVEKGADFIVTQQSHCIGCMEKYLDSTILYGEGNFISDYNDSEFWETSLLAKLNLENGNLQVDFLPLVRKGNGIRLAKGNEKAEILKQFENRSKEIQQAGFIENNYEEYLEANVSDYLNSLHGSGFWFKAFNRVFGRKMIRKIYANQTALRVLNCFECEAHYEMCVNILKKMAGYKDE